MHSSKQIKNGAIISYISIGFNIIAGLIYTPWMIKQIGKSDYGLYMLSISFLAYFIVDFGLGQSIAKFIAKYRVNREEKKINQLLGLATKLYLLFDLIIAITLLVLYFYLETIFKELTPIEIIKFKTIYLISGAFSLISFPFSSINGILIAFEKFVILKIASLILKIGTITLMIIALLIGFKLFALVAVNAFVGLLIVLIKLYYIYKTTNIKINYKYTNKKLLKELFGVSAWVFIVGIAERFFILLAPILLAIYSGTNEIAVFSIAMVINSYTLTIANALNGLFLTKVSKIATNNDRTDVLKLMIKVGRFQLFIIGILIIGLISFGQEFILLWVGNDFKNSYYVIILLISLGFISLTQEIANTLLFVDDKIKYRAIIALTASLTSASLSILLIPKYGAIGAGTGIFIALLCFNIIAMNIVYYRVLKLNILLFFKECHLKLLPIFILTLTLGFTIQYYLPVQSFLYFIPKILIFSFIYFILIWFFGLNKTEKKLIEPLIKKIKFF